MIHLPWVQGPQLGNHSPIYPSLQNLNYGNRKLSGIFKSCLIPIQRCFPEISCGVGGLQPT